LRIEGVKGHSVNLNDTFGELRRKSAGSIERRDHHTLKGVGLHNGKALELALCSTEDLELIDLCCTCGGDSVTNDAVARGIAQTRTQACGFVDQSRDIVSSAKRRHQRDLGGYIIRAEKTPILKHFQKRLKEGAALPRRTPIVPAFEPA
jgi:hypothetical protein